MIKVRKYMPIRDFGNVVFFDETSNISDKETFFDDQRNKEQSRNSMNKKMSTILICEDDRLMAQIIEQIVKGDLVEVMVVSNGALAINELKKRTFDLVITDAVMPEKTGLDVISFIRRHQRSDTPVLMMSGMSETNYIKVAKEKGVSDFLAKPFTADRLKRKVQQLLNDSFFSPRLVV